MSDLADFTVEQFTQECVKHGTDAVYDLSDVTNLLASYHALRKALERLEHTLRRALTWIGEHEFEQHEEIHRALRDADAALARQV